MNNNKHDTLENFMDSEEMNNSFVQIGIVLFLNSAVLVLKNFILNNIGFNWIDCLNPSITIFTIFFMTVYKNKNIFTEWKDIWLNKKKSFFFILTSFIGIFLLLGFNWVINNKEVLFSFIYNFLGITYEPNFLEFLNLPIYWLSMFFLYFTFTMFLILIYIPIAVNLFEWSKKYTVK